MYKMPKFLLLILTVGLVFFQSCISNSRYNLLLDKNNAKKYNYKAKYADSSVYSFKKFTQPEYRFQPGDLCLIIIKTDKIVDNTDQLLSNNQLGSNNQALRTPATIGYYIDSLGFVNLPILGKVKIGGLTFREAETTIEKDLAQYYHTNDIFVSARLNSLYFTITGEVTQSGQFEMVSTQLNVFEAIAMAGGLKPYANRANIRIIKSYNNEPKVFSLDLTDVNILNNPNFYLSPKDIIYVEALPSRQIGVGSPEALTAVSSLMNVLFPIITILKFF
jgi:polysaccharide export outer membrane protein